MHDSFEIEFDRKQIDIIDPCHYLEAGWLRITYDIGIEYRSWGIKDISVVVRHIIAELTLEVDDEASDLLLEEPVIKEIRYNRNLLQLCKEQP